MSSQLRGAFLPSGTALIWPYMATVASVDNVMASKVWHCINKQETHNRCQIVSNKKTFIYQEIVQNTLEKTCAVSEDNKHQSFALSSQAMDPSKDLDASGYFSAGLFYFDLVLVKNFFV